MTTEKRALRDWAHGPLYTFLMDTFPTYRTVYELFDVKRFTAEPEIGKSYEAIYKWLRRGKLTIDNARAIISLASRDDNAAVLAAAGRQVPEISDLVRFL